MGRYINTGNAGFQLSRNSEYVDKSGLIAVVNRTLFTEQQFSCVTRCRRFGKSMAAKMLCAYYDQSCDSHHLFDDLQIASAPDYEKHLNKYPVIYLDTTAFVTRYSDEQIVGAIDRSIRNDVAEAYPDITPAPDDELMDFLIRVGREKGERFIFIIDEWDAICREFPKESRAMDEYVNWLRRMFKDVNAYSVFAGVYMTGILPIKKYNTQSALNNFEEYSMVAPGGMASFFGFTKEEVKTLAERHGMDFDELEKWYDGYQIGNEPHIFNPNSVMKAIRRCECSSFWSSTGAYDTVAQYIDMNYEGLKDCITSLLAGGRVWVNTTKFGNDMSVITGKDDVLTVLIHLGYLSYDCDQKECYVPNYEVAGELQNAVEATHWQGVIQALGQSKRLLAATLRGDGDAVAAAIADVHDESTSILSYNDENSLSCVVSLAYYYARNDYVVHRELATGRGFADLVMLPRKNVSSPAIVVELKYGGTAADAVSQIKERQYFAKVHQHTHDILLVGVNYDPKSKEHTCIIEKFVV